MDSNSASYIFRQTELLFMQKQKDEEQQRMQREADRLRQIRKDKEKADNEVLTTCSIVRNRKCM